ncbi:hypothetical protein HCN44_009376 [Aphidius gifuensis]|uniref:Uncharacterized protein n=1 Tax=Aphidius gifuensis TaxID=684658 RepID=A0A834Y2B0_APHGI|nr:hypothetical protein HCN44_009376 [Aphidius gifuensis]
MWGDLKYSIRRKAENDDDNNNLIKNMSYYWNKTNSLLEDVSTDEWSSLHGTFPNTMSNFQRTIDNSDNKTNNEICLQNSKKQIISAILLLTRNNYQCLNNQLQNYYEFIKSEILLNHNVVLNYPSCSKKDETPLKILNCIDNEISKKNKQNSDKIYQDLLKTMNKKNTTIIKQLNDCINNNVTKHLDKIVSNTTNNFYSCIKNSEKKLNTETKSNSKLPTSQLSNNEHKKLSSLYNYQIKIMEENILERKNLFRLFEVNARSYQSDIVWSIEDASNKSVRCCLGIPRAAIGRASIIANDRSDECFTSVLSKYNQSIITQIKINRTYARGNSLGQYKSSLTLYNNQLNIFKENITKQNIDLSIIELETRSYQDDVVWSIEDGTNKSIDCCLNFPRQKIIAAGDDANFKTNQCFQSVSSKFNQSIISYLKAIQSGNSIFENCYMINKSTESILKCIDNLVLNDKSNDAKSSYEILILLLQGKFNYAMMAMTSCLRRVKIHFKSSISLAQINFNECIVNNKDYNCYASHDNVDDFTNW